MRHIVTGRISTTSAEPSADSDAAYAAWQRLVDIHVEQVWSCAIREGLDEVEAATVSELAWLRLAQHWTPDDDRTPAQIRQYLIEIVTREATSLRAGPRSSRARLARRLR